MGYSFGKWSKYKVLARSRSLTPHLPRTSVMGYKAFCLLLNRHKRIIVKPSGGSGGKGVILVSSLGKHMYTVQYGRNKKTLRGKDAAYSFVHAKTKHTAHIVQRRIPLAHVKGRPFDVRVMVQKSRSSHWHITGKLAKIAGPGFIITNTARSRGRVVPLSTAIHASTISGASAKRINQSMDRVAKKAVHTLQRQYRGLRIVGLDIGLDSRGKVWIIEANFAPAKSLFLRLKDKTMYNRIVAYAQRKR